jgi:hypothetical protein
VTHQPDADETDAGLAPGVLHIPRSIPECRGSSAARWHEARGAYDCQRRATPDMARHLHSTWDYQSWACFGCALPTEEALPCIAAHS